MSEHTEGPWECAGLSVKNSRGIIANCPTPQSGGTFDCSANARAMPWAVAHDAGMEKTPLGNEGAFTLLARSREALGCCHWLHGKRGRLGLVEGPSRQTDL